MSTLIGQIKLETKLLLRDRRSLFFTLAFPVIMILIFGSVFSEGSWDGIPAINYLLPGIIVMAVMMACMNNNAVKITNDREKGIYRRLSLTPLKRQSLLANYACEYCSAHRHRGRRLQGRSWWKLLSVLVCPHRWGACLHCSWVCSVINGQEFQ